MVSENPCPWTVERHPRYKQRPAEIKLPEPGRALVGLERNQGSGKDYHKCSLRITL